MLRLVLGKGNGDYGKSDAPLAVFRRKWPKDELTRRGWSVGFSFIAKQNQTTSTIGLLIHICDPRRQRQETQVPCELYSEFKANLSNSERPHIKIFNNLKF